MPKLEISNMLVGSLIVQVAPVVEKETGWSLDLQALNWQVLERRRAYEEVVQGRLRHAGVPDQDTPRLLPERMVEIVLEANIMAAYEPGSSTLFVVRENVDDSNLQGLMVILAHELVHRGQHLHYPALFERVDRIVRELHQDMLAERFDLQRVNALLESIRSTMTLIESHAMYVQQRVQALYYPRAQLESHFNFITVLGAVLLGQKAGQYTNGLPQIVQAARSGQISELYQSV